MQPGAGWVIIIKAVRELAQYLYLAMMTIDELKEKYKSFSDIELLNVNKHIDEYSPEAKEALAIVLKEKGGLEIIKSRVEDQFKKYEEERRIHYIAKNFIKENRQRTDLYEIVSSEILSKDDIKVIIDSEILEEKKIREDRKITPRTVIGGIIGGLISGTIGGIIWGLQMIYSAHIFLAFAVGLALFCYFTIKFFSRKTKNNVVVIIMTILAILYALALGQIMYDVVGYIK